MTNNNVMRSLRYMLETNNQRILEICKLGGLEVSKKDIHSFMLNEEDPDYVKCSDETLAHFLDGVITFKRGQDPHRAPMPIELPMSNNQVLKKLKVAFELKEEELLALITSSGFVFGKSELSSFLRKKDHRNYRPCGDQVLRYFLKGLTLKLREKPDPEAPAESD